MVERLRNLARACQGIDSSLVGCSSANYDTTGRNRRWIARRIATFQIRRRAGVRHKQLQRDSFDWFGSADASVKDLTDDTGEFGFGHSQGVKIRDRRRRGGPLRENRVMTDNHVTAAAGHIEIVKRPSGGGIQS